MSLRFVIVAFFLTFVATIDATCYNPDGSALTGDSSHAFQPCNQVSGAASMCCGTNWTGVNTIVANDVCLPSGMCLNSLNGEAVYWRSSCTDESWKSPFCLKGLCDTSADGGDPTTNVAVTQCSDGKWCCPSSNTTCCSEHLGDVVAATIGVSTSTTSRTQSSQTTTSVPADTSSGTQTSQPTNSAMILPSPSPPPPPPPPPSLSTPPETLGEGAKIGIGVGVVLLAIGISAIGFYLFFRRRKKQNDLMSVGGHQETRHQEMRHHEMDGNYTAELSAPGHTQAAELQ